MQQINYSFNINSLDPENAEYLQMWSTFGFRPSKFTIYVSLSSSIFWEIINKIDPKCAESRITISEMFRTGENINVNSRHFFKISEDLYMSLVELQQEQFSINALHFYYDSNKKDHALVYQYALENFGEFFQDREAFEENESSNVYIVGYDKDSFELSPSEINISKIDISLNYGPDLLKKEKELLKILSSTTSGIIMFSGPRGCGKTYFLKHIVKKTNKKFYYFPVHFLENIYLFGNFLNFIKKQKNPILVLEDCEYYFSNKGNKQLVDLLLSSLESMVKSEDMQIIMTMNVDDETHIDEDLMYNSNVLFKHSFNKISSVQANKLAKKMNLSVQFEESIKLTQLYNVNKNNVEKKKPGY